MKFRLSVSPVVSGAFVAIAGSGFGGQFFVSAQTLVEKWVLDNPVTTFVPETNAFTMTYVVDDSIAQDNTATAVYDKGCLEGKNELLVAGGIDDATTDVATTGVATLSFAINPDILRLNSNVFSADTPAPGSAEMKICARFMLQTDDASFEVNFIETVITITFDLTADFVIGFQAEPNIREETNGDKGYGAEAYLCDPENPEVSLDGTIFQQGSVVKVCVKPDEASIADGLFLKEITKFSWVRGAIEQPAVEDGASASNGLTQFAPCGEGSLYCSFTSMLYADFYQPPTPPPTMAPTIFPIVAHTDSGGSGSYGYGSYGGGDSYGYGSYGGGGSYGYGSYGGYGGYGVTYEFSSCGIDFPPINTAKFVHGLCIQGSASNAWEDVYVGGTVWEESYDSGPIPVPINYTKTNSLNGGPLWGDKDLNGPLWGDKEYIAEPNALSCSTYFQPNNFEVSIPSHAIQKVLRIFVACISCMYCLREFLTNPHSPFVF